MAKMRTDFCTVRVFAFLVLLRQRKLRPQVGEHFVVGLLGDVYGGAAGVAFGLDDAYHMQGDNGLSQTLDVMENILGVLYGAHDDGHLGLGGDLKDAGAEVVELAVPAGVALGEDGNR